MEGATPNAANPPSSDVLRIAARPTGNLLARAFLGGIALILALVGFWGGAMVLGLGAWMGSWGATAIESSAPLPGDELLPEGVNLGTRAVTINAPPEKVRPWIAQMGVERGGFYSYDWMESLIGSGAFVDGHSADRVHPELQAREPGDRMVLHPPAGMAYVVAAVRPPSFTAYRGTSLSPVTWTFFLTPAAEGGTRLLTRWRGEAVSGAGAAVANAVFGTMDFVMEQKMLRGIKERAERAQALEDPRP